VEDTTIGTTNDAVSSEPTNESEQELTEEEQKLVANMEEIIQFFVDWMQVKGGKLVPEKCAWYVISKRWKYGIHWLMRPNPGYRGIEMVSKVTHTTAGIKRKAPDEGHRTLGFHLAGDGTSIAHKKVMTDKSMLYVEAMVQITMDPAAWGKWDGL
jgi:hypothetical protein